MCAIAGIGGPVADKAQRLAQSCRHLVHRGPDSHGFWEDRQVDLALAHVWLAILDLSPAGHQPMVSACERYVLVLNGEIYNHMALCHRLAQSGLAPAWCGHSDTETVLACPAALGVQATLQACVGIFAFALWDRATQTLSMAHESLGEKPLYYGFTGGGAGVWLRDQGTGLGSWLRSQHEPQGPQTADAPQRYTRPLEHL